MATTIKEIGNGGEFHLRFAKTKIFKREFGSEEILIDEFNFSLGDEFPSEIIWMPSIGRGMMTWFNFNKVERFEKNEVIDYHRNLLLSKWDYSNIPTEEAEMVRADLPGNSFSVTIVHHKTNYFAHILIGFENHYFRIEYSHPFPNTFKE